MWGNAGECRACRLEELVEVYDGPQATPAKTEGGPVFPGISKLTRGRTGGRSPALTDKDLAAAKALLSDPAITTEEAARRLKIAPSTLYRHLPGGRGALAMV